MPTRLAYSRRSDSGVWRELREWGKNKREGDESPVPSPRCFFSAHISLRRSHSLGEGVGSDSHGVGDDSHMKGVGCSRLA